MPLAALVCAALLGLADDAGSPPAVDPVALADEYRQAKAASGRTPGDQIRLALWCEAHGLTAERMRHLALALLADPANVTARGLSGLVARDGRWIAPDSVAQTVRTDPVTLALLAEYDARRSKTPYNADAQWALGQWAEDQGLKDQAKAHFTAVTRLEPSRELAWKRLGYKKHDGHWITDAQLAAVKAEAEAQKAADRIWKPWLEKWKVMFAQPSRKDEAQAAFLGVTDPRAVASITRVFDTDRAGDQQLAVSLLGQIESPQASRALAALAVFASSPDVRRVAVETLRQRDPRDFIHLWIGLIRSQIKYEVRPVGGPGSPGMLFVQGQKANTQRNYNPMSLPTPTDYPNATLSYDANGLPVLTQSLGRYTDFGSSINGRTGAMMLGYGTGTPETQGLKNLTSQISDKNLAKALTNATHNIHLTTKPYEGLFVSTDGGGSQPFNPNMNYEGVYARQRQIPIGQMTLDAQASAEVARGQLTNDVAKIDTANQATRQANDPVISALSDVTGQNFGDNQAGWAGWWTDQRGYAITESSTNNTPTFVENVPINYTPLALPTVSNQLVGLNHSCFAAGTPVRTIDGTKLIEKVQRGDLVLVEDTHSGALSYQAVLTAFHNPPSATYRVKLGTDDVVATGIHRFWKAGKGWTMTRDLKPGDMVRTLGGVATVEAVTPEPVQPVFNLEVAEGRSFFVGRLGTLVHDNSLVEATPNPFDAARTSQAVVSATTTAAAAPR